MEESAESAVKRSCPKDDNTNRPFKDDCTAHHRERRMHRARVHSSRAFVHVHELPVHSHREGCAAHRRESDALVAAQVVMG